MKVYDYGSNSKQIPLLFASFFDGEETLNRVQVAFTPERILRRDQRIKIQESELTVGKACENTLFQYCLKTSHALDFAQTVQFAQVGLQIEIPQFTKTAPRFFKR